MKVEIITIGDELLIGQVVNTNASWMGAELNRYGFEASRITTVSDKGDAIKESVRESLNRCDIVLLTGGLGPTRDDITKQVLCDLFETHLVFDETVYQDVVSFLKGRINVINGLNRSQAMVPEACTVIRNEMGTAPIMWFDGGIKVVVAMPGVPSEMKHSMTHQILPRLKEQFHPHLILHKTILVAQLPESVLAEQISEWEESLPDSLSLAYLPAPGRVRLRLTARGQDEVEMREMIESRVIALQSLIGTYIYGYDDEMPEVEVGRELTHRGQTLAVAESCSGGYLSHLITSVAGSSCYFKGGVVAYSNEVKVDVLGVLSSSIADYGAVSREVAEQMAIGVRERLGADYGIATTGFAGPGGGSDENPVGTIWIAWATPEGIYSKKFNFGGIRERNILRSGETALILYLQYLKGNLSITD